MSHLRTGQTLLLLATLAIAPGFGSRTHHVSASGHVRTVSAKKGKKKVNRIHGQRAIDSNRASEIQNALIQKKYLKGEPSGQWDAETQVAMRQYQSDHGWQTKLTPDSRALISLGLGPNHVDDPTLRAAKTTAPAEVTAQVQATEPAENTLASVHTISQ
jgi:Putative peptidoglycan binding domain